MVGYRIPCRPWKLPSSAVLGLLVVFSAQTAFSYSILTHEAIIDSTWDSAIKPLLLKRFPDSTADELTAGARIRLRRKHHSGFGLLSVRQQLLQRSDSLRPQRRFAAAFGLMALILAAVGIYGVVAYTTRQRTHEIGIRMALGAGQGDVFRSVLKQGMGLALLGLAGGLIPVSLSFTRLPRNALRRWRGRLVHTRIGCGHSLSGRIGSLLLPRAPGCFSRSDAGTQDGIINPPATATKDPMQ